MSVQIRLAAPDFFRVLEGFKPVRIHAQMDYSEIARRIIVENTYLSLASCDQNSPWIAPLYFVTDREFNFYFVSEKSSLHAKQLKVNPNVAVAIFNSQEIPEKVNGLQIEAKAYEIGLKELPKSIKLIYSKTQSELLKSRFKSYLDPRSYLALSKFRIYKIIPERFYILDPRVLSTDKRVEVRLKD